jgi:hypothetical protein
MKEDFTFDNFLKAVKIPKNCMLIEIIEDMYNTINNSKSELFTYFGIENKNLQTIDQELMDEHNIDKETAKKIKQLMLKNRKVYAGTFDDDVDRPTEAFLCYSSILIDTDEIYFNAENSSF